MQQQQQQQQQQQHSFSLMLATPLKDFTGRLSCTYDRPFRLCGCWEAALISFTHTRKPAYILCDLLEYTEVNNHKVQLLDGPFLLGIWHQEQPAHAICQGI